MDKNGLYQKLAEILDIEEVKPESGTRRLRRVGLPGRTFRFWQWPIQNMG